MVACGALNADQNFVCDWLKWLQVVGKFFVNLLVIFAVKVKPIHKVAMN
jgi:hypothetical protein